MKPIHLSDFARALHQAHAAYGREPTDGQTAAMFEALSVFDLDEVQRACKTAVRELKFPPSAADLTKIVRHSRELRSTPNSAGATQCCYSNNGQRCPLRGWYPMDLSDPSGPRECEHHHFAQNAEHKAQILDDVIRNRPASPPHWQDAKVAQDLLKSQPEADVVRQYGRSVVAFVKRFSDRYPDILDYYREDEKHTGSRGQQTPPEGQSKRSTEKPGRTIDQAIDAAFPGVPA